MTRISHLFVLISLIAVSSTALATADVDEAVTPASLRVKAPLSVMIDPGHGGADSGAVSGGVKESDLVLQIALKLEERMHRDQDFSVVLTRRDDRKLQLHERVQKADQAQVDLFVSLHANSSTDSRARGMEIYFQNHIPPDEETLILAALENQRELLKEDRKKPQALSKKNDVAMIIEDIRRSDRIRGSRRLSLSLNRNWTAENTRIVRQAPFHVVTRISIPSVLMELGFLTNRSEREQLQQTEVQERIVENIYEGLIAFKNERAYTQNQ